MKVPAITAKGCRDLRSSLIKTFLGKDNNKNQSESSKGNARSIKGSKVSRNQERIIKTKTIIHLLRSGCR